MTYLILGYGVPDDIKTDLNYQRYLGLAFNAMFQRSANAPATIVACGGRTDIHKPYKRSEASEIAKIIRVWSKRSEIRSATAAWAFLKEERSLSTVENLLYAYGLLQRKHIKQDRIVIFCEHTRRARVRSFASKIFAGATIEVIAIDFDLSSNRYLDASFIKVKERKTAVVENWALQSPKNLREYRRALQDRLVRFRKAGPDKHVGEIKKWWEEQLNVLVMKAKAR